MFQSEPQFAVVIWLFQYIKPRILRPISLLSVFSKILERLMYNRLLKFLIKHNFFLTNSSLDFEINIQHLWHICICIRYVCVYAYTELQHFALMVFIYLFFHLFIYLFMDLFIDLFIVLYSSNNLSGTMDIGPHKIRLQAPFVRFYIFHDNEICISLFMDTNCILLGKKAYFIVIVIVTKAIERCRLQNVGYWYDKTVLFNTIQCVSLFPGHSGRVQLDNEADREPDYVLMSMGPSQNELTPWAVVTSTALADEVGNVYPVGTGTGYVTSNCRHKSPASLVIC